jgi:hypothetical protein
MIRRASDAPSAGSRDAGTRGGGGLVHCMCYRGEVGDGADGERALLQSRSTTRGDFLGPV